MKGVAWKAKMKEKLAPKLGQIKPQELVQIPHALMQSLAAVKV
jgi:hypothetical protein